MILGCGARKSDTRAKDLSVHPFLATKPLSSGKLVLAKIASALLTNLASWIVVLAFLVAWALLPATLAGEKGRLGGIVLRHTSPGMAGAGAAVLGFLVVWTLRNQVIGLFVDLT